MRKPQVSTILIGLTAGVAIAALGIAIATAISARNSASGLKHLTLNVCKESSLTARNVEAALLVLDGAAQITARDGSGAQLRAYWRTNQPAIRAALRERQGDSASRQKLSDCLRVRDGIVVKLPRGQRHTGKTSGKTSGKTTTKTTTNTTPFSGSSSPAPANGGATPHSAPRPTSRGRPGPTGATGSPGTPAAPAAPAPAPAPASPPPAPPGPGLPSIPIPCVPILHPC